MQTQSPRLQQALVAGRQWITNTVEVIEGGAGPADPALATLEPDAGSATLDETRASRRTCTGLRLPINDANADLIPGAVGELLHPATGNELRIRSGRKYGRTNLVPDLMAFPGRTGTLGPWRDWGAAIGNVQGQTTIAPRGKAGDTSLALTADGSGQGWVEAIDYAAWSSPPMRLVAGQQFWAVVWAMPIGSGQTVTFEVDGDSGVSASNRVAQALPANVWTPLVIGPASYVTNGWSGTVVGGTSMIVQTNGAAGCTCLFDAFGLYLDAAVDTGRPLEPDVDLNAAGVYRFDKLPVVDSAGALMMTVAGLDRAFGISRHRWTDTFHVPTETTILDGIRRIAVDRWTGSRPLVIDATACAGHPILEQTVPNSILGTDQTNTDPYADMTAFATAGGCELFFDEVGRLVVRPFIDPGGEVAVASYTEGIDCAMTDLQREIDPTRTFSGIVVTGGSGTDRACRAVVWDEDPTSPTFVGKVGYIAAFYDSPLLRTPYQCRLVGEGLLKRLRLSSEIATFSAIPNPGLEGADAVYLSRERVKATGIYGVSGYTLPLDMVSAMSLTTRSTTDIPAHSIT